MTEQTAPGPSITTAVRELKRGDGPNLGTQSSSELAPQLLATDLIDELRLLVYPILLGPVGSGFHSLGEGVGC